MFYIDVFKALEQHQVRYLLVGVLAVNLCGIPRTTMDIDLVVALDAANLQEFVAAVSSLAMQPVLPLPLTGRLDQARQFTLLARTPETARRQERLRRGEGIVE